MKTKLFFTIMLTFIGYSAKAQWLNTSCPCGGQSALSIVSDGTNIFASNNNGVYLSSNNGGLWTILNNGQPNFRRLAINGSTIYGAGGSVYVSTNNGATWTNTGGGTDGCIAVSGSFISTGGAPSSNNPSTSTCIYYSSNNGGSWTATGQGMGVTITAMAISGSNIYAGTSSGNMALSTNNWTSWTNITGSSNLSTVNSIAVSGTNVFIGTSSQGVHLTTNNGGAWTSLNTGLTDANVTSLAISGSIIFAGTNAGGVCVSFNNGALWTPVNEGLTSTSSVSSIGISGSTIFIGVDGGVYKRALSDFTTPTISANGVTLTSSASSGNQWYLNGNIITGATSNTYTATQNGTYTVKVYGSLTSATYNVTSITGSGGTTGISDNNFVTGIDIYPNPTSGIINIELGQIENAEIKISDVYGKNIFQKNNVSSNIQIDLSAQANGIYFVHVITKKGSIVKKAIVSK